MKTILLSLLVCFSLTGCFEGDEDEAVVPATNGTTCIQNLSELIDHEWRYVWIHDGQTAHGPGMDMTGYNYTVRITADTLFWNDNYPLKYPVTYSNNYANMHVTNLDDQGNVVWETTWNPIITSCDTVEIWGNSFSRPAVYEKLYIFVR